MQHFGDPNYASLRPSSPNFCVDCPPPSYPPPRPPILHFFRARYVVYSILRDPAILDYCKTVLAAASTPHSLSSLEIALLICGLWVGALALAVAAAAACIALRRWRAGRGGVAGAAGAGGGASSLPHAYRAGPEHAALAGYRRK